jgi:hypothetical protein
MEVARSTAATIATVIYAAQQWIVERLRSLERSVRPPVPGGPAMGSWRDRWDRVVLALHRKEQRCGGVLRAEPNAH